MIDKAIDRLDVGIQAQIKVMGTGRGIAANAQAFNELVQAKNVLLAMLKPAATKAAPRKKVVVKKLKGSI